MGPELSDGSVSTRVPFRLFPLSLLLMSPQVGNDLPWPAAKSGVMSQLVLDFVAQKPVFSPGFLVTALDIFLIKLLVLIIAHCGRILSCLDVC